MRISRNRLLLYFIPSIFLFNLYFFSQFLVQKEYSNNYFNNEHQQQQLHEVLNITVNNKKEFLVLDWTAHEHLVNEQDPIECNFSDITPAYCQSKFDSIRNNTLRFHLIKRCSRLSTLIVRWTADQSRLNETDLLSYSSIQMPFNNLPEIIRNDKQQQFSIVYVLESEIYSQQSSNWDKTDFQMWYNLERSYPEPITYFNLSNYLEQLFSPVQISFSKKTTNAPIVWISSNCDAYNGRNFFIRRLMSYIRIDSYGHCLNNIKSDGIKAHKQSNSVIYSSYKFVIAIENSNCEDYVTEKLVLALSSTSIPIIASRDRKPDYARFAPKYSYINVYDYKSIKELADYLNYLSSNETAYNEYLWFRQPPANKYTSSNVHRESLNEYLHLADEILGENATMRKWLLTKETSMNKYCKLARFIYTNDWKIIDKRKRVPRPTSDEVCLPENDLVSYFSKEGY